jgi:arginine decarboxylase
MARWTHLDSETLFNISKWGLGFFRINDKGNVEVRPEGPDRPDRPGIDMAELLGQILRRGVSTPILMRFDGILRSRVRNMNEAFNNARKEFNYEAPYRGVFPIKVNQERHVVEALLSEGANHSMGLEAGSKPELIAVVALMAGRGSLMICNGYKDEEYIEMALLSTKLGITPIIVVEKFSEIETILRVSKALGIRPRMGLRSKLSGKGAGRWQESGGDRSKFGLTTREIVMMVETLEKEGMLDCLELLHFHLGSQIPEIRSLKNALREATYTLVSLTRMGCKIKWFDVGGGLGVDYDGSSTSFESSMNYSLQEYANDVVYHLAQACADAEIAQPAIVTESGRALTAHHAVLVTEVLGTSDFSSVGIPSGAREEEHEVVHHLATVCENVTAKNHQESYHDAVQLRDEAMVLFNVGQIGMRERARVEEFFWRTCEKILRITRTMEYVPDDLANLERDMADTYFLNFSLFQSVPDSWAIHQLFPIMPLHRHLEQPTRHPRRHHLRLRRQGGPLHRPARREAHAGAAPAEEGGPLLPRLLPRGRLSGDPGRHAQPVRRHERRACRHRRERQAAPDARAARRARAGCARVCRVLRNRPAQQPAPLGRELTRRGPHQLRGVGQAVRAL